MIVLGIDTRLVVVPLRGRFFLGLSRSAYRDVDLLRRGRVGEREIGTVARHNRLTWVRTVAHRLTPALTHTLACVCAAAPGEREEGALGNKQTIKKPLVDN